MNDRSNSPRLPGSIRGVLVPLVLAGLAALAVDVPLARLCFVEKRFVAAHDLLEHIEPFGQPISLLIICAAIALCDPRTGRGAVRIALAAIGSGLAADVVKLLIARIRPYHMTPEEFSQPVWATFRGILPLFSGGSRLQSCPSAHSAFVTGFCLALTAAYPAGRWLFAVVAVAVACQRIETGAHFLSDTCWGGAVGYLFCWWLYHGAAGQRLQRWENPLPSPEGRAP